MTGTDPGVQPERTLLAWRRTTLSFALASVAGLRLTLDRLGSASVVIGLTGLALATATHLAAIHRYRRVHHAMEHGGTLPGAGAQVTLLAATSVAVGLLVFAYLVG